MFQSVLLGTWLNALGIVLGAVVGLTARKSVSPGAQAWAKTLLGAVTIFCGMKIVWDNISGKFLSCGKQFLIVLLALVLGRLLGRLLRLQKISNRLGQFARERLAAAGGTRAPSWSDGFNTSTALFCAAPLAVIGAVLAGVGGSLAPLGVKTAMDALAAAGFAAIFGWSVAAAALPVFVYQGALTLVCARLLAPWLAQNHLTEPIGATCGLLVMFVALVIFEVRKIELADYLPSLAAAPLLVWWWR
ncbi:MAG: hypothetical protein RLZZ350_402 [Verrucomicrobiota bacterium]|jgi:uncharacterized membrane protein YqgA involved in biofilm formation